MTHHPHYVRIPTENEVAYFKNRSAAEAVIGVVIESQKQEWMQLHGFVVLPEALEMVLTPLKHGIPSVVAQIQAETIPLLAILLPNANIIWERRYVQMELNSRRAMDARLAMLLLAPVASGLVDMAAAYPYSSANQRYVNNVSSYSGFENKPPVPAADDKPEPKPEEKTVEISPSAPMAS